MDKELQNNLPVVPLRDMVVYPHGVLPLFIGTEKSILALQHAQENADKKVVLIAKRDPDQSDPKAADLFDFGTISTILQLIKLPDGTVKILVEGSSRAMIENIDDSGEFFTANVTPVEESEVSSDESEVLVRSMMSAFEQYGQLSKKIPPEVMTSLSSIDNPSRLVDTIAAQLSLKLEEKQQILEMTDLTERLEQMMKLLESEIDLFKVEKRIRGRVKNQMEKEAA